MKRVLYTDPRTKKDVYMNQNSDGSTVIETTQRFDDLIKINKQMNNDYRANATVNTQRHIQHVAEIPNVVYNHLLETLGPPAQNPKGWKAWLNNSENRDFRTGGGNI
mgnify:CR=1 FL=1